MVPRYKILDLQAISQALGVPEKNVPKAMATLPTLRCDRDLAVRQAGLRSGDVVSFQRSFPGIQTQTVYKQVSGGSHL